MTVATAEERRGRPSHANFDDSRNAAAIAAALDLALVDSIAYGAVLDDAWNGRRLW
jgi:hypothetical protein